jgi:hypothetical protein
MASNIRMVVCLCIAVFLSVALARTQANKNLRYTILSHYRLNYDKNVPDNDVQLVAKELQRAFEYFQNKLALSPADKIPVYLYSSKERPRGALLYKVFDDSYYSDGRIVILASALHDEQHTLHLLIDRVVARAFLNTIVHCPIWMAETYSLAVGYEFTRFGNPTRSHLASFSDLGEDISRAEDTKDLKAVYAGIAATAKYFIDQYGEGKLDAVIKSMRGGHSVENAFESAFGGKYDDIERAWAEYMRSLIKG